MNRSVLIFLSIIFVAGISDALAETIELKNGREIIGKVIQETEGAVVVSKHEGAIIYSISRDRIKSIRNSTPEEMRRQKRKARSERVLDKKKERRNAEELSNYRLEKYKQEVLAVKRARGEIKIHGVLRNGEEFRESLGNILKEKK